MAGEIVKEEERILEQITKELGSNMAIETVGIQGEVVSDTLYEVAMKSSDLLLTIGCGLVSSLTGPYSTKLDVACGDRKCSSQLVMKRKKIKIDTSHECGRYMTNCINILPEKRKINFSIDGDYVAARIAAINGILNAAPIALAAAIDISFFSLIVASGTASFLMIENGVTPFSRKTYTPETFFRDISRFAYNHSREKADSFINEYISLPGRIYDVAKEMIERNNASFENLSYRQADLNLLEEKLI